ncbi:MAG TPA: hypothetical protein VJ783_22525 [Pirellulales bacterium]|nr:hypothetical protein [Pirellulales bacterium]
MAAFGITKPTRSYERWVKDDGFDSADFSDVVGESEFIFRVDWKTALPDELPLIADALAKWDVDLKFNVKPDEDSGFIACNGREAKVKYTPNDEGDFTDVIAAIQSILPENIEFRAAPNNASSDTWEFAILPRDEWAGLEKLDRELVNSLFVPLSADEDLAGFFSQRGIGMISISRICPPDEPDAEFLRTSRRHSIDEMISLAVPDNWEVWEPSDDILFIVAAPDKGRDEIQPHFFVTKESNQWDSSRAFMIGSVVALRGLDGYEEHEILEFEVGTCAIACVSYDAPAGEWIFTNRQYMFVLNDWAYLITCKMLPEQSPRWSNVFDAMVRSLGFAAPEG